MIFSAWTPFPIRSNTNEIILHVSSILCGHVSDISQFCDYQQLLQEEKELSLFIVKTDTQQIMGLGVTLYHYRTWLVLYFKVTLL